MPGIVKKFPMLNLRAGLVPSTLNQEARTVEVTWTTGARGLRQGFWEDYYEELAIEPENINLERFIGAVVLDQHRHDSMKHTLGVVESAYPVRGADGKVCAWNASVRFAKTDDAELVFQMVCDGIARSVSVGYFVETYEELPESLNQCRILRATRWTPAELSFVTVPFDAQAAVRSTEALSDCTIIPYTRSTIMPEPVKPLPAAAPQEPVPAARQAAPAPAPSPAPSPQPAVTDKDRSTKQVLTEIQHIRQAATVAGFSGAEITRFENMLAEKKTLNGIRALIVHEAAKRQGVIDTTSARATVGEDLNRTGFERGVQEVFLARALPSIYRSQVTEAGRPMMRDSVVRLAERLLDMNNVNTDGMSKQRVIAEACKFRSGSHSTSDFFYLFESTVDRVLRDENNRVTLKYLPLSRNEELPDFRDSHYVMVGDNFELERQDENEELKYGTFTADGRAFRLATYSKGIIWSRRMMINDDLSVLNRLPSMVTRAGDKLRSRMVWALIVGDKDKIGPNGVTMGDGSPLFAPVHGNLASTGGGITKASVGAGRKAIRHQKAFGDKDSVDTLDLEPQYLICGPEREQEAIDFLAANFVAVNQQDAAAINLTRSLTLIVENRIVDDSWYLASTDIDGIITATLQGEDGVFLDSDTDFETDGFKLKGRLDFGVHMARWEGWYKNPGK